MKKLIALTLALMSISGGSAFGLTNYQAGKLVAKRLGQAYRAHILRAPPGERFGLCQLRGGYCKFTYFPPNSGECWGHAYVTGPKVSDVYLGEVHGDRQCFFND